MADTEQVTCEAPDCDKPRYLQSTPWCVAHYRRMKRHGSLEKKTPGRPTLPTPESCAVEGCDRAVKVKGRALCGLHYQQWLRTGSTKSAGSGPRLPDLAPPKEPCALEGCNRPRAGKHDYCRTCLARKKRTGSFEMKPGGPPRASLPKCARCGKAFKATKTQREKADAGRKVYCSRACQKGDGTVTISCSGCGVGITRRRSDVDGESRHFCTAECRNATGRPTKGRWKQCEQCGDSMWVIPAREGKARFCSSKCRNDSQKDQVEWVCEVCGNVRSGPRSKAVTYRYCSTKCAASTRAAKPGDRYVQPNGYVWLYVDDGAGGTRRVSEHRHAWEQLLGFPLPKGVEVHHLSGDRSDNRIEATWRFVHDKPTSGNLQLWDTRQPAGQDHESKMRWAREIMAWDAQLRASGVLSG